jgi:hypothetical protein
MSVMSNLYRAGSDTKICHRIAPLCTSIPSAASKPVIPAAPPLFGDARSSDPRETDDWAGHEIG